MNTRYYIINEEPILTKYIDFISINLQDNITPLTQQEIINVTRLGLNDTCDIDGFKIRRVI